MKRTVLLDMGGVLVELGGEQHFLDLEKGANPGLWWPDSPGFKNLLDITAETCGGLALFGDDMLDHLWNDCPKIDLKLDMTR